MQLALNVRYGSAAVAPNVRFNDMANPLSDS